jgi:hypothetical protein
MDTTRYGLEVSDLADHSELAELTGRVLLRRIAEQLVEVGASGSRLRSTAMRMRPDDHGQPIDDFAPDRLVSVHSMAIAPMIRSTS